MWVSLYTSSTHMYIGMVFDKTGDEKKCFEDNKRVDWEKSRVNFFRVLYKKM